MGCLTELAGFVGILTTIMAKSAVRAETVIFIVHLMKNSSIWHKCCEKAFELYSLWKVIEKKVFYSFASVLSLKYVSMENSFNHHECGRPLLPLRGQAVSPPDC